MIKNVNEEFFVLKTDNGFYLCKSCPYMLMKDLHKATMYQDYTVAKRCLTNANERFNLKTVYGNYSYAGTEARKLGVGKIMIAKITLQQYDEIII